MTVTLSVAHELTQDVRQDAALTIRLELLWSVDPDSDGNSERRLALCCERLDDQFPAAGRAVRVRAERGDSEPSAQGDPLQLPIHDGHRVLVEKRQRLGHDTSTIASASGPR